MAVPSQFQALTIFEDARHVRRLTGVGLMRDLLRVRANVDTIFIYDDFLTEAADQTNGFWIKTNSTNAICSFVADTAQGIARIATGVTDNEYGLWAGQLSFNTSLNPLIIASVKSNAVTSVKIEVGWSDSQTNAGCVNAYDTPTSTGGDYAVGIVDTDGTNGDWWALITQGSTAGMNATATQSGEAIGSVPATQTTAAAAVYDRIGVSIRTITSAKASAQLYRNGKLLAAHGGLLANQIKAPIPICPFLFAQSRTTTSRLVDTDYAIIMQDRS